MSFIQRELDRISAALQSDPDDKDYDRLYAAQQALAWALDPLNFAHPMRVIKGLNWAEIMDSAVGRSLDPLISYKADPPSFPSTMKLVPRPKGSPNEFHAMDSPGWDNWQDGPGATIPTNTTDDHIDPYGQNADRSSYTAESIAPDAQPKAKDML